MLDRIFNLDNVVFRAIDQGKITSTLKKNKQFRIKMKIRFYEDIKNPIFAYIIKDRKGTEITGTNTLLENYTPKMGKKGEEVVVNFAYTIKNT